MAVALQMLEKVLDIYGMIVGTGIGDISIANIKAFRPWPSVGIALSTIYILIVTLVIIRLFCLQPNMGSLTAIMRSQMNSRVVSMYTLLTALTFTCGGLVVAANACKFVDSGYRRDQFVMIVVIVGAFAMWLLPQALDRFCAWSGAVEIIRYAMIIIGSFVLVRGAQPQVANTYNQQSSPMTPAGNSRDVLNAIVNVGIFSFAGFESAAQESRIFIMVTSVMLASATYMLTAQASVELVLSSPNIEGPEIVPRLAEAASTKIFGTNDTGVVHGIALVIQIVAVVNGTAGCIRYSTRLMHDTQTAGHLGPFGRLPSALLVFAAASIFWCTGSHTSLLSIFAAMNTVSHGFSAYTLLRFASLRKNGWDGMLACACLLLVCIVVLAVFVIDEVPGFFALAVAGGVCLITLLPTDLVPHHHQE